MMPISRFVILLAGILLLSVKPVFTQGEQAIERSVITETIDGKEYYLHFVKRGETLFAIARAYGLTANDLFRDNPEARQGISAGSVLKIPVRNERDQATALKQEPSKTYFYHIVKKQETLYGIAKKYGISIETLKGMNPRMGEYPKEGETLMIPYLDKSSPEMQGTWEGESIPHTVAQGETLYGIARQYNVTIGEIKNANPGLTETLQTGAVILIPNQGLTEQEQSAEEDGKNAGFIEHEVAAGETLYGIAREYGYGIDTLQAYNPGLSSAISPGQVILVPSRINDIGYIVHRPEKNESLDGISRKYEVPLGDLAELNPDIRKKAKKGQSVRIPVEPRETEADSGMMEAAIDSLSLTIDCFDEEKFRKETYNIALMLPLFLEEVDSIDFDREKDFDKLTNLVSFRFVNFYNGFKMAVDSLTKAGMKINLFVYDVDNDPAKVEMALLASELSSMDLIVGPFYLSSFRKMADFASTYNIPIINPLSKRDEITYDNPWVFKVQPSEAGQIDFLVNYLQVKYPASNIILLRNNKYKYQSEISYIRNSLNTARPSHVYIRNRKILEILKNQESGTSLLTENKYIEQDMIAGKPDDSTYFSNLVREVVFLDDSLTGLTLNLSRLRPNVVVALSDNIVFSKEVLSQLNKLALDHDITLFGLPGWNDYQDLETSHLLNLKLHTFSPALVNFKSVSLINWTKDYRRRYNTEPSPGNYAFDGFDVGWYFLNALHHFGRDFEACLPYYTIPLLQTRFEFEQTPGNGFQNTHWNLGVYDNYEYRKIHFDGE